MDEFDRVLDRKDVLMARGVDTVDHRRERRGLTGTGRTCDQDQPTGATAQVSDDPGQAKVLECLYLIRDRAKDRTNGLFLLKDVYAESRYPIQADREIEFLMFGEIPLL